MAEDNRRSFGIHLSATVADELQHMKTSLKAPKASISLLIELNLLSTDGIKDPIDVAITKYSLHPSVKRIKDDFNPSRMFEFALVSKEEVYKQLDKLDLKKATPLESIPAKILKGSSDVFLPYLTNIFNLCLAENYFPNELKKGDVSSL